MRSAPSSPRSECPAALVRLLLEVAGPRPDAAAIRAAVEAGVDWEATLEQASHHGLEPLLHWWLGQACPDALPAPVAGRLRAAFDASARRNLALTAELFRVLSSFQEEGIPVLPVRGPVLAWSLYESPALREMGDLDLVVPRRHFERARDLLLAGGYGPRYPGAGAEFFQWIGEFPLVLRDRDVAVDLHWKLAPPCFEFAAGGEDVWKRLSTATVAGRSVPTLGQTDLLLFLAVHGAKHGWSALSWLCDVARLIEAHEPDWDCVLAAAQARRATRILLLAALLAHCLCRARVPDQLRQRAEGDRAVSALAAKIEGGVFTGYGSESAPGGLADQLRLLERARDKARCVCSSFQPTPADVTALGIPAKLFPVYYLARPVRLLAKHGSLALRRLLKRG